MSSKYWSGKRVLITGGTSGLGLALTEKLQAAGARVAVVARGEGGLAKVRARFPEVQTIQGDVGSKNQIHRIHAEVLSGLGEVDVLINNASTLGPVPLRLLADTDCEDLQSTFETNVAGPFRLTKLVLPSMLLNRSGVVVNISSDAAIGAYPRWGAYGVSKAALDLLTRTFQAEHEHSGVHFLALDPGDMNTPLHQAAVPDADPSSLNAPEDSAQRILQSIEIGAFVPVRRGVR